MMTPWKNGCCDIDIVHDRDYDYGNIAMSSDEKDSGFRETQSRFSQEIYIYTINANNK